MYLQDTGVLSDRWLFNTPKVLRRRENIEMAPRRARTRSEVIVRDQIDRLLQILRIVGEVIRTAGTRDRYLLDLQRNMIHPSLRPTWIWDDLPFKMSYPRDYDRNFSGYSRSYDPDWRWGDAQLGKEWQRIFTITRGIGDDGNPLHSWGTIQ